MPPDATLLHCPTCQAPLDVSGLEPLAKVMCPACGSDATVPGQIDKFRLLSVLGRGGMGIVFKAYDPTLDRQIAVKLLPLDHSQDTQYISQLETEAALTASVNHPNVVRVYRTGFDRGRFYIAMELVEHGSLAHLIRSLDHLPEDQVLDTGIQIAKGLRAALQMGLIHRDVKPGNILFADAHTAKLVDFGLAIFMKKALEANEEIWGTPYYIAPEKLELQPEDHRSDIYSLGATLFHALAGRPPFEAEDATLVAMKRLKAQSVHVHVHAFAPHVSKATAHIIDTLLQRDPAHRFQTYDELIENLEYAQTQLKGNGGKTRAMPESEATTEPRTWGWTAIGLAAAVILILLGAFFFGHQIFTPKAPLSSQSPTAPDITFAAERLKLISGDSLQAATALRAHAQNPETTQPAKSWALLLAGLAEYDAGRTEEGREIFRQLANQPPYSQEPGEATLAQFFIQVGRRMSTPEAIDPAIEQGLNRSNYEALALLLYGIKAWQDGHPTEAVHLLQAFRSSSPAGQHAWIGDMKLLAATHLEQYAHFQEAARRYTNAASATQRLAALEEMKSASTAFGNLIQEIVNRAPEPRRTDGGSLGDWITSDFGSGGTARLDNAKGEWTIATSGKDFWTTKDTGLFVGQNVTADFELIARLASMRQASPYSKAGLMVRDRDHADASNLFNAYVAKKFIHVQVRPNSHQLTVGKIAPQKNLSLPLWLKLTRSGGQLTVAYSTDGQRWTAADFPTPVEQLPDPVSVGLAVCSNADAECVAVFDSVQLTLQGKAR